MPQEELPIIDVSALGSPTTSATLDSALHEIGFLYLKNHGVSTALQTALINQARQFFDESLDFKMKISMKKAGLAWRGYFPLGGELTSGKPDQKEGLYFGRELDSKNLLVQKRIPLHGSNLWPSGPKYLDFKSNTLSYIDQISVLAQKLLSAIGTGLGLPKDYFLKRFTSEPTTLFRIFNYPKHVATNREPEWGVREHTDMGFLTILLQDQSGGLEVKSRLGKWISVPPLEETFVVNIGDMLEVWTHGIYRATPHRVLNQGQGSRISIPFFFDPHWDATLEPIDRNLLSQIRLKQAKESLRERWDGLNLRELNGKMTYGEFVWQKVKNVFPDLARQSSEDPP